MRPGLGFAALAATLACSGHSQAVDAPAPGYSPAYQRCLDAPSGQSTAGMIGCIAAELSVQDARLNTTWRRVTARLNPRQKAKLQAAQRAWIAYRDADCRSLDDADWGTISRIAANQCMLRQTMERTAALAAFPDRR